MSYNQALAIMSIARARNYTHAALRNLWDRLVREAKARHDVQEWTYCPFCTTFLDWAWCDSCHEYAS